MSRIQKHKNFIELSKINLLYAFSSRVAYLRSKNMAEYMLDPSKLYKGILLRETAFQFGVMLVLFGVMFAAIPFNLVPNLLDKIILFLLVVTIVQTFSIYNNVFYESKDTSFMKSIPVTQKEVFYSKLAISSLGTVSTGLPQVIIFYFFFTKTGMGLERIFYSIALTIILNFIVIFASLVLTMMTMKITSGSRGGKGIINVVSSISQLAGIGIVILVSEVEKVQEVLSGKNYGFLSGILVSSDSTLALILITTVIMIIACIFIDKFIASNYYKSVYSLENRRYKKKNMNIADTRGKHCNKSESKDNSIFRKNEGLKDSLTLLNIKYFLRLVVSKSTIISSALITPLIMPMIVSLNFFRSREINFSGLSIVEETFVSVLVGIIGGIIINSGSINLPSIIFSVDGYNYEYIKSTPYDILEYAKGRLIAVLAVSSVIPLVAVVGLQIYSKMSIIGIIVSIPVFLLTSYSASSVWMIFDLKHFNKDWQNITDLYNRFSRAGMFAILMGVTIGLFIFANIMYMTMNLIGAPLALLILLVLWIGVCTLTLLRTRKRLLTIS